MRLDTILSSPEGDRLLAQVSTATGLGRAQAEQAVRAIVPEIVFGLERNTFSRVGLADLLGAIASGHHEGYLDNPDVFRDPTVAADGNKILGHVLGSEGRADKVASRLSADTGIDPGILRTLLPGLAALVLGWVFRNGKGALGDVLQKLPRGTSVDQGSPADGGFGAPAPRTSRASPGTGGMGFPSGRGDSFDLPDLGRGSGGVARDNPYGDLSDILRQGGKGSGGLTSIVRDVLGGLLGFQSGGILGWIIRMIVTRWGWSIVKLLFRSLLGGGR